MLWRTIQKSGNSEIRNWGSANYLKGFRRIGDFGGWVSQGAKECYKSGLYDCMFPLFQVHRCYQQRFQGKQLETAMNIKVIQRLHDIVHVLRRFDLKNLSCCAFCWVGTEFITIPHIFQSSVHLFSAPLSSHLFYKTYLWKEMHPLSFDLWSTTLVASSRSWLLISSSFSPRLSLFAF